MIDLIILDIRKARKFIVIEERKVFGLSFPRRRESHKWLKVPGVSLLLTGNDNLENESRIVA